jgi:hypothetical protein
MGDSEMSPNEDERDGPACDAADLLRWCQMPPDEIRWVLTAEDPGIVHMILELHRERLEEELAERRNALDELERWLVRRSRVPSGR